LVLRSLFGLGLSGLPVRSSPCRGPKDFDILGFSSLSLSLLSRVSPLCRRCRRHLHQALHAATASRAVSSPSASFQQRAATYSRAYQSRVTVPSQRFARSQGLYPPVVSRPYFMPVPPMGFTLQGRFPLTERYALSSALPSCG